MTKATNETVADVVSIAKRPPLSEPVARVVIGEGYKVEVEIRSVSPEQAMEYLGNMTYNRPKKRSLISYITRQMKLELWTFTGEPLIFDEWGFMIEGQHRCLSSVASGKSFVTLIVRGVPRLSFDRINSGAKRSTSDIIAIGGARNSALCASVLGHLESYRRSGAWWHGIPGPESSAHELAASMLTYPGIDEAVRNGLTISKEIGQRPSLWATARYLTMRKDESKSMEFFGRLASGLIPEANWPEYPLRKKMLALRAKNEVETAEELAALIVNAWNARRRGKNLSFLRGLVGEAKVPSFI